MVVFDIIGNVKIQEGNTEKIRHLIACIKSYEFLKKDAKFYLNVEGCSAELYAIVKKTLSSCGFQFQLTNYSQPNFGGIYCEMLNDSCADYIINFESDHFMLCDSAEEIKVLLTAAYNTNVDIIRASFSTVEIKSSQPIIECIEAQSGSKSPIGDRHLGKVFDLTPEMFNLFNHAYPRYYVGTNAIFRRFFALKFWSRKFDSKSPHPWEISHYTKAFEHRCMVPSFEVQASVEDDHGEQNTCLLKRNEQKFVEILKSITL